jgi:FkbM family methyltransferase
MGANSLVRRAAKRALSPFVNGPGYRFVQAAAMAWDIRSGRWREPEIDLIACAVRPGDSVLDLGANYGVYSYYLSRAVGASGRVYAFEPVPFTSGTLRMIIKVLGLTNVKLVAKGCSDVAGIVDFDVPVQTSGAISAGQAHIADRNDDREGKEQQVRWNRSRTVRCEVVALDQYLGDVSRLTFVKCDIEGAELLAFRGAERLITAHRPTVVCEINPWFLDGFGLSLSDLTGFFVERGYIFTRYVKTPSPRLERITDLSTVIEDNYVFVHESRANDFGQLLLDYGSSPA